MMRSSSSRTATPRDRIASQTVEECYFNRKHGEELSTLREGELVRVRGKGAGKIRNISIVRNCKLTALQP